MKRRSILKALIFGLAAAKALPGVSKFINQEADNARANEEEAANSWRNEHEKYSWPGETNIIKIDFDPEPLEHAGGKIDGWVMPPGCEPLSF